MMCIHKDKLVPTVTPNGTLLNVKCTSTHPAIYPSIKAREYKKTFGEFPPMNEYFLRRIASLGEVELAEQYGIVRCSGRDPPYVQPVIYKPPDLPVVVPPSRAPPSHALTGEQLWFGMEEGVREGEIQLYYTLI